VQSRAPEYGGTSELAPLKDPQALAALAGESAAEPHPSPAAPAASASVPPAAPLPGAPRLSREGLYVLSDGGLELTVEPASGSIAKLSLDGRAALLPVEPKPPAFRAEVDGSSLLLANALGGQTKRFRIDAASRSVEIRYTLVNTTATTLRADVADVHRIPSTTGLTFFPGADKAPPIIWLPHERAWDRAVEASVHDGERWVASVHDGLLLVKVVSDAVAPFVSIFADYDPATQRRTFVEIDEQSRLVLAPGESATCTFRLFVRRLPPNLQPKSGNQELVGFVRGIIQ